MKGRSARGGERRAPSVTRGDQPARVQSIGGSSTKAEVRVTARPGGRGVNRSGASASPSLLQSERTKREACRKREQPGQSNPWKLARRLRQMARLWGWRWGFRRRCLWGRWRCRRRRLPCRRRWWRDDDRYQLERRHVEFTKVVRVLAGLLLEPAADLHPATDRRIRDVAFFRVVYHQRIGPWVGRARCLRYAGHGPSLRPRQHVLPSFPPRTSVPRTRHPTATTCPSCSCGKRFPSRRCA